MHILGLGEIDIEGFRKRFLSDDETPNPNKLDASDGK
jgi:hypothetical protein